MISINRPALGVTYVFIYHTALLVYFWGKHGRSNILPMANECSINRFMICCDRCEEWFHGDCVGITEARGRLMERNGEDYICPNCTAKKNQVVRPATSALSANTDKPKADNAAVASSEKTKETDQAVLLLSTAAEERATDDLGIKGRIEKASNPTGKKKIKIFQPVGHWKRSP